MSTSVDKLKIFPLIRSRFDDVFHDDLDFSRHLKSDEALTKRVDYHPNGRPILASYYDSNQVKMAQIRFQIEADPISNLINEKKLWLSYVKNDDSLTEEVLIKWLDIDPISHAALRLKERKEARSWIVEDIEINAAGVLSVALNKTILEIEELTAPYFDAYDRHMHFFVKKGSSSWKNSLQNDDLSAYASWMLNIPAWGGMNLRDYILSRLDY